MRPTRQADFQKRRRPAACHKAIVAAQTNRYATSFQRRKKTLFQVCTIFSSNPALNSIAKTATQSHLDATTRPHSAHAINRSSCCGIFATHKSTPPRNTKTPGSKSIFPMQSIRASPLSMRYAQPSPLAYTIKIKKSTPAFR